jgi:hypothetical protein
VADLLKIAKALGIRPASLLPDSPEPDPVPLTLDDRDIAVKLRESFRISPALAAALGEVLAQVMTAQDEARSAWRNVSKSAEASQDAHRRIDETARYIGTAAAGGDLKPSLALALLVRLDPACTCVIAGKHVAGSFHEPPCLCYVPDEAGGNSR